MSICGLSSNLFTRRSHMTSSLSISWICVRGNWSDYLNEILLQWVIVERPSAKIATILGPGNASIPTVIVEGLFPKIWFMTWISIYYDPSIYDFGKMFFHTENCPIFFRFMQFLAKSTVFFFRFFNLPIYYTPYPPLQLLWVELTNFKFREW